MHGRKAILTALLAAVFLSGCSDAGTGKHMKAAAESSVERRQTQLDCYAIFTERFKDLDFSGINRCDEMIDRGLDGEALADEMMVFAFPNLSQQQRKLKLKELMAKRVKQAIPPQPPEPTGPLNKSPLHDLHST